MMTDDSLTRLLQFCFLAGARNVLPRLQQTMLLAGMSFRDIIEMITEAKSE